MIVLSFLIVWASYIVCMLLAAYGHTIWGCVLSAAIIIFVLRDAKNHV